MKNGIGTAEIHRTGGRSMITGKYNKIINAVQIMDSEIRMVCENVEALAEGEEGVLAGVVLKLLDSTIAEVDRLQQEILGLQANASTLDPGKANLELQMDEAA